VERLSRDQIEGIVLSGNEEVRGQFVAAFDSDIQRFIDGVNSVFEQLANIAERLPRNSRCAWAQMFLFAAANNLLISFHLLVNGFLNSSGNLMRSWTEAIAMALLCSSPNTGVYEHLTEEPDNFPVQKAPDQIRRKKIAEKLDINQEGWGELMKLMELLNKYSHASAFSLTSCVRFDGHGSLVIGGDYDPVKEEAYQKEISLRISACERLIEVANAVERQLLKIDK